MVKSDSEPAQLALSEGQRRSILFAVMMTIFMPAMEITLVATALPSIATELGGFHLYGWVFSAFMLAQAVTSPLYGKLGDLYGRRRTLFAGAAIFLFATLLCGLAASMPQLVAARALQGLGAGAIMPMALTIVADIYPARRRAQIQGYLASVWGISALAGPALSAFFVTYFDWRFVFWVNLPIGLVAMSMIAIYYREEVPKRKVNIDAAGVLLLVIASSTILYGLVRALDLSLPEFGALVLISIVAFVLFIRQERRAKDPMMPLELWQQRIFAVANGAMITLGAATVGVFAFLPAHIQGVLGASLTAVAIGIGIISIGWSVFSAIAGRLVVHSSYRLIVGIGSVSITVGIAILALAPADADLAWIYTAAFFVGAGLGFCHSPLIVAVQTSVPWNRRGTATSATIFCRLLGQALGAALLGAVITETLRARVPNADEMARAILDPARRGALTPAVLHPVVDALADGLHNVYVIAAIFGVLVILFALGLPRRLRPGG